MKMLGKRMHSNTKNGIYVRSSGKGKDILPKTSASRYNKSQLLETSDLDANVTFPYIRLTDNSEQLPCYSSILTRSPDEGIGMKDLDQLQQELEKLLSVSAVRSRLLNSELEFLDRVEDRYEKKGKSFDKPPSPKHRKIEEKIKQVKDSKPTYKLVKNFHDEVPKLEAPKLVLPKNDTKSKFWLSADAYCASVTGDDSAYLNELLEEINQDVELKIGEVGQHYVEDWAVDSRQGSNVGSPVKKPVNTNTTNGMIQNKYFCAEPYANTMILPLASALLEENINMMPSSQEKLKELGMKPMNNGVCLDKRLRNELAELGILDSEDNQKANGKNTPSEDEIAQEIKLCHKELCKLNANNKKELNRLYHAVNKDITRQQFFHRLDEVDTKYLNELLEEINQDVELKIGEVGQHYVEDWAVDSRQGSNLGSSVIKPVNTNTTNGMIQNKYFCAEPYANTMILPLASVLLEENINMMPSSQEKLKELGMKPMNNGVCLDKRLPIELAELGILDSEDNQKANGKNTPSEDEIAQEIKLCHKELCKLNANNKKELIRLYHAVNKDITRQQFFHRLDEVDTKIMDIYNKFLLTSNPKNKNNLEWQADRIIKMQKELHKEAMDMPELMT